LLRQIVLSFLIVCHSSLLFSQNDSATAGDAERNTNRIRVLIGYSHFVEEDKEPKYGNVFLNGNYRINNFDSTSKIMSVKWQFEAGGHSSFFFEKAHSLIYIAVGIGFK
jgi:hypothetical protein